MSGDGIEETVFFHENWITETHETVEDIDGDKIQSLWHTLRSEVRDRGIVPDGHESTADDIERIGLSITADGEVTITQVEYPSDHNHD